MGYKKERGLLHFAAALLQNSILLIRKPVDFLTKKLLFIKEMCSRSREENYMSHIGRILGGTYQIVSEIGTGGVGIIYLAYHLNLQKYVVVKKIKENFTDILEARIEVDILKALQHSNLPQVYDFLRIENEIYTVMDYIPGYDLKYYIDQGYYFDERTLWYWFLQLCDVLDYLHKHKILHLDIKPANIMVTEVGKIYLIDFNIAWNAEDNKMTGISKIYASPEQYRKWQGTLFQTEEKNIRLDQRTDIYSLGITFYQMMSGQVPDADLRQFKPMNLEQSGYSKELVSIIQKMIRPAREFRFKSVADILKVIDKIQKSEKEKSTLKQVFLTMMTGIMVLLIAVGILFFRNQSYVSVQDRENIALQEKRAEELCQKGEFETAYREIIDFLNINNDVVERVDGARQAFYEQLADCCMGMERYSDALYYLNELEQIEKKPEYVMDKAVSYAYLGDYESARICLEEVTQEERYSADIEAAKAEIMAAKGELTQAVHIYQQIEKNTDDIEISRRLGILALQISKEQIAYGEIAIECFENIREQNAAAYADQMNLVSAYLICNRKQMAVSLLQEMCVNYPEKYESHGRLAVLKYQEELDKPPSERDFSKVRERLKKAITLYEKSTKQQSDEIDNLKQLLDTLS